MRNLVIVESPTKARTLSKFLGDRYQIEASMGHVRDLPKSDIGVDIEHNFEPKYIIPKDKVKRVNELKKLIAESKILWLATDPDREGEAIAWHLAGLLRDSASSSKNRKTHDGRWGMSKSVQIKRVVFHEITPGAVKEAFGSPRTINLKLVDAQQARRVLDRLVGYRLSPLLWKKIKSGLSAGRVQSVALRLIVEREREVEKFKPQEYWSIIAKLQPEGRGEQTIFTATLIEEKGKKLSISNKTQADKHLANLKEAAYSVSRVTQKEVKRHPHPPFTTSTLQQVASLSLGLTAKKTMMVAQHLYEQGLITYMRTDSVNLSPVALKSIRSYIESNFGKPYLPNAPRFYKSRSKLVQEAHEAIRVTDIKVRGEEIRGMEGMRGDHVRLYDLILKRTLSCQMNEAVLEQTIVDISASAYTFQARGSEIKFDGWLKVYGQAPTLQDKEDSNQILPKLSEREVLELIKLLPEQHFTEPPARYNEASLIKKLEELGIGRPSTYAPTISTIVERFYVERRERKFFPTELGVAVTDFLVDHFPDIVDFTFTAQMEDELDEIAKGEREWKPMVKEFYFPFEKQVEKTEATAQKVKIEVEEVDKRCPNCGRNLQVKFGRFGKFLACPGFPGCKYTESFEEEVNAKCPKCGGEIVLRRTKRGRSFYGCKNWPNCAFASWTKPKSTGVVDKAAKS